MDHDNSYVVLALFLYYVVSINLFSYPIGKLGHMETMEIEFDINLYINEDLKKTLNV